MNMRTMGGEDVVWFDGLEVRKGGGEKTKEGGR
jgi:hypothetical protein